MWVLILCRYAFGSLWKSDAQELDQAAFNPELRQQLDWSVVKEPNSQIINRIKQNLQLGDSDQDARKLGKDIGTLAYDWKGAIAGVKGFAGIGMALSLGKAGIKAEAKTLVKEGIKDAVKVSDKDVLKKGVVTAERGLVKGSRNPVVKEAAANGRKVHAEYNYGEGFRKEVSIKDSNGKVKMRVDALNQDKGVIKELKPDNYLARKRGLGQLERAKKLLNDVNPRSNGQEWEMELITYKK